MYSLGTRLAPVLKTIFINVSYHILVASLTLMALFKTEPSKLETRSIHDSMNIPKLNLLLIFIFCNTYLKYKQIFLIKESKLVCI